MLEKRFVQFQTKKTVFISVRDKKHIIHNNAKFNVSISLGNIPTFLYKP